MKRIPMNTVELTWWIVYSKSQISSQISSPKRAGRAHSELFDSMKKIGVFAVAGFVVIAIAGVIVFNTMAAKTRLITEVSQRAAKSLQEKIDAVREAENSPHHTPGTARLEVSEAELESYLLYALKDDIPAR